MGQAKKRKELYKGFAAIGVEKAAVKNVKQFVTGDLSFTTFPDGDCCIGRAGLRVFQPIQMRYLSIFFREGFEKQYGVQPERTGFTAWSAFDWQTRYGEVEGIVLWAVNGKGQIECQCVTPHNQNETEKIRYWQENYKRIADGLIVLLQRGLKPFQIRIKADGTFVYGRPNVFELKEAA